jgi:predicted protein tyrosine phosphatase
MIEKILVVPRHALEDCFERPTWLGANFSDLTGMAIISIYSTEPELLITEEFESQLKKAGCTDTLSLLFGDITSKEAENLHSSLKNRLFSIDQAREIITFLDHLKTKPIKVLLIHCDAGVSRSAAVGVFACRYLGMDEKEFRIENNNIQPNPHVYNTLYVESGLRQKYQDFWTENAWKDIPADPDIERMFK